MRQEAHEAVARGRCAGLEQLLYVFHGYSFIWAPQERQENFKGVNGVDVLRDEALQLRIGHVGVFSLGRGLGKVGHS